MTYEKYDMTGKDIHAFLDEEINKIFEEILHNVDSQENFFKVIVMLTSKLNSQAVTKADVHFRPH
jgi:hypothetical protein